MNPHNNPNLSVANAFTLCKGVFTRVNTTKTGTCKSILYLFIVCDKILPYVTKVEIDENGKKQSQGTEERWESLTITCS